MKKMTIGLFAIAAMLVAVPEAMADHHGKHHGKGNDGLRLAAGIVNLVKEIVAPAPQIWHVMALDQLKCDFSKTGHLWGIFYHNGE